MFFHYQKKFALALIAMTFTAAAYAANEGQEDLDKATEAKLSATTLTDLGEVIRLSESALQKGLDESNTKFANRLLTSALVQRATVVTATIFKSSPPDQRWPQFRQFALADLEKAVKLDEKQPQALFLVAQLNLLPEGDAKRAKEAIDKTIEFAADDPPLKAKALVLRSGMEQDLAKRLPDLNEAVRLIPADADTIRNRGLVLADLEKYDDALADLNKAIELNSEDAKTYLLKSIVLTRMKKYDDALATLDQALKIVPNAVDLWLQKTSIHSLQKKNDEAIEDLTKAVEIDPTNAKLLLLRSSMYLDKGEKENALADARQAVQLSPKYIGAIRTYAALLVDMGKFDDAISQLEKARRLEPNDSVSTLQLGMVYIIQKKSAKAAEIYSEFLKEHPSDAGVLRARGDSYLNVGKQTEALADYEKAYKDLSKESGFLNNYAWVLATSTNEKLRDGKRAVEMATEACELTEYKKAHILSTLAAAYAETGDFDSAIKWSTKSAEIGEETHAEDFKKELETYKARKPYRELLSEADSEKSQEKPLAPEEKTDSPAISPVRSSEKTSEPEEKPTKSNEPAAESIQPFNGKNLEGWTAKQPRGRNQWTIGAAQVDPQNPQGLILSFSPQGPGNLVNLENRSTDIYTAAKFGDCIIALEFMIPKGSDSGVYVMGEYGIQINDCYGKKNLTLSDLGAISEVAVPKLNAAKLPGEWQSFIIDFKAPRFENGVKTANARFEKITLNDQIIHENVEMKGPTPGGLTGKESPEGPLMFQGDRGPAAFRNIKISTPSAEKK